MLWIGNESGGPAAAIPPGASICNTNAGGAKDVTDHGLLGGSVTSPSRAPLELFL